MLRNEKEVNTDLYVAGLLNEAGIIFTAQGSEIEEIEKALKSASKKGTGKSGFPEYVCVVKDFILVIEDKASVANHIKKDDNNLISTDTDSVLNYAVNGAVHYAKHIVNNTNFKKVIAFGVSGNARHNRITPVYIDETENYIELDDVKTFISFNENNIHDYYIKEIVKENTDREKELKDLLKDAEELHNYLRDYGNLKDAEKPLVVSGILLALKEQEHNNFSIDFLTGDTVKTDGKKIYDAIKDNLTRANVSPEVKKDKILSQFSFIESTVALNEVHHRLGKTPLRFFAEFLNINIFKTIKYNTSAEDYIGRFYGEFMSYQGGDGQSLGIVLTPKHITQLFCDLANLNEEDVVLDPCCGTGAFLIAAMHNMLKIASDDNIKRSIRHKQLHGIEQRVDMFTIATTNMILRGDGKSNLINGDFFKYNPSKLQLKQATVGMINPPYSQGSRSNPECYEINFIAHLLDSLLEGGRCIAIVPQSSMAGKSKDEQSIKEEIFAKHTLEGVITLNPDTFYNVGTMPCIAVFTAHYPHPANKKCKFINFENDGYKVFPHIGLLDDGSANDKKQYLLDVWNGNAEFESRFCVETAVESTDEWLHSFYYFNDEIPSGADFDKTVGEYLSFEFDMIMQGRNYLFKENSNAKVK